MLKTSNDYPIWLNLAGYQLLWFLAVFNGNLSLIAVAISMAAHLYFVNSRGKELVLMCICICIGVVVDSSLTLMGVYIFDPTPTGLPIPWWLLGIWIAFAATLRHGLRFFIQRPPLALACAIFGAPLAYISAAKFDAVSLPLGYTKSALIVALIWIPIMLLLIYASNRIDRAHVK